MDNISISFSPTQEDLDVIEEWLLTEDQQKPFLDFTVTGKTASFPLAVKTG